MDPTLEALMRQVAGDLELAMLGGQIPAVVRSEGRLSRKVSDDTYWAKPDIAERFERRAAQLLVEAGVRRFVFGVPVVMLDSETDTKIRRPLPGPRVFDDGDYEEEVIWLLGCDLAEGIEVGRVDILREHDTVMFGDLMVVVGEQGLLNGCPGFTVLRQVMASID